jgi:hypothetical protein
MITALASAALVPIHRLAAGTPSVPSAHTSCDKKLAAIITALERGTWEAWQANDAKAWGSLLTDRFFEITADGWISTKQDVIDLIHAGTWQTPRFEMSEIEVFRPNENTALIRYVIEADFLVTEGDVVNPLFTHATAISVYVKIRGKWLCCSYQETTLPDFQGVP